VSEESRGNYARVVQYQQLIPAKKRRQLSEHLIRVASVGAIQQQQPRSVAPLKWPLRDLLFRKEIVQFVETHECSLTATGLRL
jgi:hypothetical protein